METMNKNFANMNQAYRYIANDVESYESLASKVITTGADVALFPSEKTIIVTPTKEAEDVIPFIGEHIDNAALNFHIYPIEVDGYSDLFSDTVIDGATAKKMAKLFMKDRDNQATDFCCALNASKKEIEAITKDRDNYQKWYRESYTRESKIKEQVKAIGVLLNAIYPND